MLKTEGYLQRRKILVVCNGSDRSMNPNFERDVQNYDDTVGISELLYLTTSGSLIPRPLLINVGG